MRCQRLSNFQMYNEFHIRVRLPCKELILKTLLRPPNCHVYQFVYHAWGKIWLMTWVIFDKANQRNVGKGLMYLLPEHVPTWVHENRFPIHVQLKKYWPVIYVIRKRCQINKIFKSHLTWNGPTCLPIIVDALIKPIRSFWTSLNDYEESNSTHAFSSMRILTYLSTD